MNEYTIPLDDEEAAELEEMLTPSVKNFIHNNFTDEAVVYAGRELARLTASDLAVSNMTNNRLNEIARLARKLERMATIAMDLHTLQSLDSEQFNNFT